MKINFAYLFVLMIVQIGGSLTTELEMLVVCMHVICDVNDEEVLESSSLSVRTASE